MVCVPSPQLMSTVHGASLPPTSVKEPVNITDVWQSAAVTRLVCTTGGALLMVTVVEPEAVTGVDSSSVPFTVTVSLWLVGPLPFTAYENVQVVVAPGWIVN